MADKEMLTEDVMAKQWIAGAVKHKGALRKSLGVPAGQKIPAKKLQSALNSDDPTMRKRAQLAKTFASFRGGKS